MSFKKYVNHGWKSFNTVCEQLQPVGDLFVRFWVAKFFIVIGWGQIHNWSTTLMLFQFEYHMPLLSPMVAAIFCEIIQLGVSVLLLLGVGGRIPALILFIFNILTVLSYPFLWTSAGYIGLRNHIFLGILLMILVLHGNGKLSIDHLFKSSTRK